MFITHSPITLAIALTVVLIPRDERCLAEDETQEALRQRADVPSLPLKSNRSS